ncbi:MAG: DUF1223 domain-containing protein [Sulfitobacter sp.]|nr:DUF1223 domain-containing protein [Sulfitobacter sp.]
MPRVTRILTAGLLGLGAVLATPLAAEQRPVVVELYTSQGCSSCPPADKIFAELADHSDVIAIALHVDYWDYIGWKDEFAHPGHADRQRAYAAKAGRRSIYTPEMVVNGETDIVGAKPMDLSKAIAMYKDAGLRMDLDVRREGGRINVQGSIPVGVVGPMDIHVLHVTPKQTTEITRGENRSHTFEYTNIGHDLKLAGTWDGLSPLEMSVDMSGDDPVVVLVQLAGAGPIVAAARLD